MIPPLPLFRIAVTVLLLITIPGVLLSCGNAATTSLHVTRYASDDTTVLNEKTFTLHDLTSMKVEGDGKTHYYVQGATNDENDLWDEEETKNIIDLGAVKGTNLGEIIKASGNMSEGETIKVRNESGESVSLDYYNIFEPDPSQGSVVLCWSKDGAMVDGGYSDGMRLVFFADTSINKKGLHIFGNSDMALNFMEDYWYKEDGKWPASVGLALTHVNEIDIYSFEDAEEEIPIEEITDTPTETTTTTATEAPKHKYTTPTTTGTIAQNTSTESTESNLSPEGEGTTSPATAVNTIKETVSSNAGETHPNYYTPAPLEPINSGTDLPEQGSDSFQTPPLDSTQAVAPTVTRYDVPRPQGGSFIDYFWYVIWRALNIFE